MIDLSEYAASPIDARALLFVPGNRPERFARALAAGADVVVVDLEDAVPAGEKETARDAVISWLQTLPAAAAVAVRVNAVTTPWHDADVAAVAGRTAGVMLPKAGPGDALTSLGARTPVIALVETAAGVLDVRAIATTPGVVRLAIGTFDLAAELGVDPLDQDALRAGRSALVLASSAAGLPGPIDGVWGAFEDEEGLGRESSAARRLGFTGKLCIHPRQVPIVLDRLRPGDDEIAWARRVLHAASETAGAVAVAGAMIDKPVLDRARRVLAQIPKESHDQPDH